MNNYIVTFEYRVMVTAFAILAMFSFIIDLPVNIGRVVRLFRDNGPIPIFRFGCSTSELLKLFIDKPYVDYPIRMGS